MKSEPLFNISFPQWLFMATLTKKTNKPDGLITVDLIRLHFVFGVWDTVLKKYCGEKYGLVTLN